MRPSHPRPRNRVFNTPVASSCALAMATAIGLLFLFAAYATTVTTARAAKPWGPEELVRSLADSAIEVLSEDSLEPEAREARLRQLLTANFDVERISRFVLGKHWKTATDVERAEYRRLFEDYILIFYGVRLENYSGETLKIGGAQLDGDNGAVVSSEVGGPAGSLARVDWRLRRSSERWHIVDLVVEGVSLAITLRSEFDSVIRGSGGDIEGLLVKLREITA